MEMRGNKENPMMNLVKVSLDNGEKFRYVVEFDELPEPFKTEIKDNYIDYAPKDAKEEENKIKIVDE